VEAKLFSERHEKALRDKKIRLTLRVDLRRSIHRLMMRYSIWGGWDNEENRTCDAVVREICDRRGWKSLLWWNGEAMIPTDGFEDFIERGTPHHVLDTIELFRRQLDYKKIPSFVSELNLLFDLHHSPIRFFSGEYYIIDSTFLELQVLAQAQELLEANDFQGALNEFLNARNAFTEKDYKRAVLMANHAFESTLKIVLGVERKPTSELIKKACYSGFVPTYYEGFLASFHDILNIVPITRTNEAGHGQGKEVTQVSAALAELTLHLSGALVVFLIKRYLENQPIPEEDVPF